MVYFVLVEMSISHNFVIYYAGLSPVLGKYDKRSKKGKRKIIEPSCTHNFTIFMTETITIGTRNENICIKSLDICKVVSENIAEEIIKEFK